MKKVIFIKNALVLTVTSLILRLLGVFFKIWLAKRIGSEGIGLYQLVFSFYVLVATFATGGISTAVTRLVADELILGSRRGVKKIMRRSFSLTIFIAAASSLAIFVFASPIARFFIGNSDAAASLRALSFSLFFMGVSSCIKGYFIARRKTLPPSSAQIFEQIIRIVSVFFLVGRFGQHGIAYSCAAVLLGDTIAEAASCIYLYLFYRSDTNNLALLNGRAAPPFSVFKKILHIAGPITSGRYINSGLRTLENILVPKKLVEFGITNASALSFFGMIKGMALPILFFPSTLLGAITTLLIGLVFGALFFICGEPLGRIIYNDASVGRLIKYLAPLVPLMYLDSISDGILKGLDLQMATFRHSVIDSSARIVLIFFLLPIYGEAGFIAIMYLSNLFTCLLNLIRLIREAKIKLDLLNAVLLPSFYAVGITLFFSSVFSRLFLSDLVYVGLVAVFSLILYFVFLLMSKIVTKEEIQGLVR